MAAGTSQSNRPRVVIADDHPHMVEAAVTALQASCEIVAKVSDGQAAVEVVRSAHPDVVVLDVCMPVLSGLAAAVQIVEMGLPSKIVFMTAHEHQAILRATQGVGGLGFVTKPRLDNDLPLAVREAMQGRRFVSPTMIADSGTGSSLSQV